MDEMHHSRFRQGHRGRILARVAEIEAAWNRTQGSVWGEQIVRALERDDVAGPELARLDARAALSEMHRLSTELSRLCAALGYPVVGGAAQALAGSLMRVLGGKLSPEEHDEIAGLLRALKRTAGEASDGFSL